MKIKTSTLTRTALDYAVAIAKGMRKEDIKLPWRKDGSLYTNLRDEDGNLNGKYMTGPDLIFSRMWEAGGPIIEREFIELTVVACGHNSPLAVGNTWCAAIGVPDQDMLEAYGPTPLIAAMRCFVASKLGNEVDIPDRL